MFFRRRATKGPSFDERLHMLGEAGFHIERQGEGRARVTREGFGAMVEDLGADHPSVERAGLIIAGEIASLVDGGFQKFWRTPGERTAPALAEQLTALHEFEESLREGLGLTSLYNLSLGTTFNYHHYDRVQDRDLAARPRRPWQR